MKDTQRSLIEPVKHIAGLYGGFSFGGQHPDGVAPYNQLPAGTVFPNGAKTAILLTFDVEGNYGNGTGHTEKEIANYKRICDKLARCRIPATFNVVGKMADDHGPDFINWMFDSGCEVASHGYWHDLDKIFHKDKIYAGHYGLQENLLQIKHGIDTINKIKTGAVTGIRLPYGHFNEFSYQAMETLGLQWASNVGIDDFIVQGQGFGGSPFQMRLGDRTYNIVEIPLDSQTFDWPIWVADQKSNKTFVQAVNAYCQTRNIKFQRTPADAVTIWRQRIADAIKSQTVFTLLCHPINLTIPDNRWSDPVDEFLFPVIDILAQHLSENQIWPCTCSALRHFYRKQ